MTALQILTHAWRMITHDPAATLRVVLVPILVATVPILAFNYVEYGYFYGEVDALDTADTGEGSSDYWFLFSLLLCVLGWIWVAISWHRYTLSGAVQSGWIPRFPIEIFAKYLGKAALITVLLIPILIIGVLLIVAFEDLDSQMIGGPSAFPALIELLSLGLIFLFLPYVFLRFGPSLVSIALGKSGGLREAWQKTASYNSVILQLSLAICVLYLAVWFAEEAIATSNAGQLVSECLWCILELLHISVITTLYGVIIEGRDLQNRA